MQWLLRKEPKQVNPSPITYLYYVVIQNIVEPEDKTKTVQELIDKVKNDSNMPNSSKMDTLAILVMRFVEENSE